MKVAVCDDEKVFHREITSLLRKFQKARGIDIFIDYYENGDMLLNSKYEYDVIFMDYQMEKMNGIEISRKLRKKNSDSIIDIPIKYFQNNLKNSQKCGIIKEWKKNWKSMQKS